MMKSIKTIDLVTRNTKVRKKDTYVWGISLKQV
jgi:hypothetical protein